MTDVTVGSSGFLYILGREARQLEEKRRKDTETTVKTVFEAIDAFLHSLNSKLSRLGPFS